MNTSTSYRTPSSVVVPAVIAAVLGASAALTWGLTVPGVRGVVTASGQESYRVEELDNVFVATLAFVGVTAVCGLLTGLLLFRGGRRTPRGVAVTLLAAVFGVAITALLGQALVDARFAGPGAPGLDFTAAPTVRLHNANFYAPADHSGGFLADLSSWVMLLVWPGFTALWCTAAALFGRLPAD